MMEVTQTKLRSCRNCYFNDQCASACICDNYTPLDDEYSDGEIEEMIERDRDEFRHDYIEYISEYNDDLYW